MVRLLLPGARVTVLSTCVALVLTPTAARSTPAQSSSPERPTSAAAARPTPWRYGSEQEWIVSDVLSALAALANPASDGTLGHVRVTTLPGDVSLARFRVEVGSDTDIIEIHDHIWSPSNYIALAKRWTAGQTTTALKPSEPGDLLSQLTTPRVDVIERLNQQIGAQLAVDRLSPRAHEDAALLLAVLALREAPNTFADIRHILSRMTAHLAISQVNGVKPTENGEVAALAQVALAGRQRDALEQLTKWESRSPSPLDQVWIRALKLRVTGDWRLLDRPKEATLLERAEYMRALYWRVGTNAALGFMDDSHLEQVANWTRILASNSMTVESGNRFADQAIALEVADAARVWEQVSGRPVGVDRDASALIARLNDDAGAGKEDASVPIDWATWAGSFERHIAAHVVAAVVHENKGLGRKDVARDLADKLEALFGHLRLYPMAKLRYALDDGQYADAMKDTVALIVSHPESVTSSNWLAALEPRAGRPPIGVTSQSLWFTEIVPAGTGYDAANRAYTYQRTKHLTLALVDTLRQRAPYEHYLLTQQMWFRYGAKVPFSELQREVGGLADYDSRILAELETAAKDDPAIYVPVAERRCRLSADSCRSLAAYLTDHERDDEAARVYQQWVDTARDSVGVSNGAGWLVGYYYTHGQRERAVQLADRVAEVFSYRGLVTKGRLLERMGNYRDAEDLFKQASDRYTNTSDLTGFYVRWSRASGDPGVKTLADTLVAKVFNRDIERPETFGSTPPADGARVRVTGARGAAAGFKVGDVIVAVDGIAVHNYDQFQIAWMMELSTDIAFTKWSDGAYSTIRGPLRDAWISGQFVTYRAPAASTPKTTP